MRTESLKRRILNKLLDNGHKIIVFTCDLIYYILVERREQKQNEHRERRAEQYKEQINRYLKEKLNEQTR